MLDEAPPPSTCTEHLDAGALAEHIDTMQFEGWGAVNRRRRHRTVRLPARAATRAVLHRRWRSRPTARLGQASVGTIRQLAKLDFATSFWTRSSADGRFVGNGGGHEGATITDLQTGKDIEVDASYDPGFFPDNSGFMFQGAPGGTGMCAQSVLDSGDDLHRVQRAAVPHGAGASTSTSTSRGASTAATTS